jgi:N-glycosylase/DNA lyase
MITELNSIYNKKKKDLKKRLKEFRAVWEEPEKRIFSELCFCICTPQSKAIKCDEAISYLSGEGILYNGGFPQIRAGLKAVRFPNNKAKYILEAREKLKYKASIKIKDKIDIGDIFTTREWLVKNIKGLGFKEASHFLRNIGFGKNLAILDVHIIKNMKIYGVIRTIPKTISNKKYINLENRLRKFSKDINIPMDELDLLLWSKETGQIFK